jgi:uncharacterized protein YndB with AHSA1/START domain
MVARDRIEREVLIAAPAEVVWAVVTQPEHISGWFSDSVEVDLRPGGDLVFRWDDKSFRGRVERVEPPQLFAFRWALTPGEAVAADNSTLVEFRLAPEGDSTRLTVVESGFDAERQEHYDDHELGWQVELGHLDEYTGRLT